MLSYCIPAACFPIGFATFAIRSEFVPNSTSADFAVDDDADDDVNDDGKSVYNNDDGGDVTFGKRYKNQFPAEIVSS